MKSTVSCSMKMEFLNYNYKNWLNKPMHFIGERLLTIALSPKWNEHWGITTF
ncbi:MAG: hypothetical protein GZ094_17485 [Mariniphaga sp.]|nr:hypothetical protein [Mariniphaga sp.]